MDKWSTCSVILALTSLSGCDAPASVPEIDPEIAAALETTRVFDHHAHPTLPLGEGQVDSEFNVIHLDGLLNLDLPVRLRPGSELHERALESLWGNSNLDKALARKAQIRHQEGERYAEWVLDRLGIDVMIANRVRMGPGLSPPRFLWVPFADPLIFPFRPTDAHLTPDRKAFHGRMDELLEEHLSSLHLEDLPPTLDGYLSEVLKPILQKYQQEGAAGLKLLTAYLRSLQVDAIEFDEASEAYRLLRQQKPLSGTAPNDDPYDPKTHKTLEDYLIRAVLMESGRLGLVVHIHTGAGGGAHFSIQTCNPLLLEPVLKDLSLAQTRFVLIHGGWPFTLESTALLSSLNVYADISGQSFLLHPHTQGELLRQWLNWTPEKIFFGTDAYPYYPGMGWEESAWMWSTSTKRALGLALTQMLRGGEVSRERALKIVRLVLWENAASLYNVENESPAHPESDAGSHQGGNP